MWRIWLGTYIQKKSGVEIWLFSVPFDWEIRISDFAIEREIRKQTSPPRSPSSWWISITKSKSAFHGFVLYRSIGKSEKEFAKLFSWTVVFFLLIYACACKTAVLKNCVSNPFSDFPPSPLPPSSKKKKRKAERKGIQEQISQRWNSFSDFVFDCKSEIRILKSNTLVRHLNQFSCFE